MQPNIRPIQPKDDAEMGKIIKSVLTEFKANKPGTAYFDESTNHLSATFINDKSAYWVVEENEMVIGGGGIYPTEGLPEHTCEMVKLYLSPQARNRGLGKAIILKCFEKAIAFGYQNVYLETMPELDQAVNLYERLGFEHQPCALGNTGHFGCNIWMVKKLI
jgi:putative acetyltransferase